MPARIANVERHARADHASGGRPITAPARHRSRGRRRHRVEHSPVFHAPVALRFMDDPVLARPVRRRPDRGCSCTDPRANRAAGFEQDGKQRLAGRGSGNGRDGDFYSGAATDQRIERSCHYRHRPLRRRRTCVDLAWGDRPMADDGVQCRRLLRGGHYRRRCARQFRRARDRPGLPHDRCDRGHDRDRPAAQGDADGRGGGLVECSGQRRQYPLREWNRHGKWRRSRYPCDVRFFPGRLGTDAVRARLAPVAIRTGGPDRHAGDAADAVVGLAGVPGEPGSARAGRRRLGDRSGYRRRCRR